MPRVAILPWGDVFEDYLEPIGLDLEAFAERMTGGWMFGYIDALTSAGAECVLVVFSSRVRRATRLVHRPSGTSIRAIPASRVYRAIRTPYLATPPNELARVLREERITHVLCQEYEDPRFDIAVRVGRRLGIPVMATFQGGNWQRSPLERFVRRRSLAKSAGVIIASRVEAERVRIRYGVEGVRIFNPLDRRIWYREDHARESLGISAHALVAAWHGRIDVRRKGLDILIDAWKQVRARLAPRDPWLYMLGSGQDSALLRSQGIATIENGIRWSDTYELDRGATRRLLSAADVYVFPSRHEGFAVAPLEAMACGLPVVASDAPGVEDIFERGEADGGIIVPREDANALADALERVLTNATLRSRLASRGRARVDEAFALDVVGRQLIEFFDR
jgi:starch synthase